jgi:uncharacterized membrane protein YgcG
MFRSLCALLFLVVTATAAIAAEEILLFGSDVEVRANGDFIVTEIIRVNSEGRNIRRGIYRDFPVTFVDANGNTGRNGFDFISAKRDGRDEAYRVVDGNRFVRVYLGQEDVFLPPGVYTYVLTYRTDRQIRFFDDHDEVFWNATGTEWAFPIEKAFARIDLPDGATAEDTVAYTGSYGSREQNARATISDGGNTILFETTRPLGPREGMTVGVKFAKGFIEPPSQQQQLAWYLRDNAGTVISIGGLCLVIFYYLWAWVRVGRDPPRGIVVPRWELPGDVSPALTHYIWNKGLKRSGFPAISASAINLAVKGYLVLEDIGETLTIERTEKPLGGGKFPVGESTLISKIDGYGGKLKIDKSNGTKVSSLASKFRSAMEKEHRSKFYRFNIGWIVPGVVISVLTIIATLVFGGLSDETIGLSVPAIIAGIVFTSVAVSVGKRVRSGFGGKLQAAMFLFFIAVFVVNSGLFTASGMIEMVEKPLVIGAVVTLVMVNVLFFFLMGAPTLLGNQRTDEIEGLKRYLTVAEKDRMNMAGAPTMSPQHYEQLLPFAVALGVEKPWSKAFQAWLAAAVATGAAAATYYGPSWYRGDRNFGPDRIGDTMGGLASSMANSFTASLPSQSSSSSGFSGGGSSGSGGGGGGGGGW